MNFNYMMKYRSFAIVGKGGSGKSTFTSLFAKELIKKGIKPLLIDADPTMSHLSSILGIKPANTIEKIRQELIKVAAAGTSEQKSKIAATIDEIVENAIVKQDQFSLLVMGQPETAGCFCPSNTLLRDIIETISKKFEAIIIDCEAGVEQIHRNVITSVDHLVVLSDSSLRSIETAENIRKSADKFIKFKKLGFIVNNVNPFHENQVINLLKARNFDVLGLIPKDPEIEVYDLNGTSLMKLPDSSKSISAIKNIITKMELEF